MTKATKINKPSDVEKIYTVNIKDYNNILEQYLKNVSNIAWIRAALFFAIIVSFIFLNKLNLTSAIICSFLLLCLLLVFVKKNINLKSKIRFVEELIKINEEELNFCNKGDFSLFNNGAKYIDYEHSYSFDIDLFGKASLFQFINRTCTVAGESILAGFLKIPLLKANQIKNRQESVKELSSKLFWRQDFQAAGRLIRESESDKEGIINWLNESPYFYKSQVLKNIVHFFPVFSFVIITLIILNVLPIGVLLFFLLPLLLNAVLIKSINHEHGLISGKLEIINKYRRLLEFVENEKYESEELNELQNSLMKNGKKAGVSLGKLSSLAKALDNRQNIFVAIVLNTLVLWDLKYIYKIGDWKTTFCDILPEWFNIIGKFDAMNSFGGYAFNFPSFVFPIVKNGEFILKSEQMSHPLIPEKQRISNDLEINNNKIFIITGANMAGKSTFLRTVGINLVLAMNGGPVCAKSFDFSATKIITSVRTNDSLHENESYFYAELKKLQRIITNLKKNQNCFFIIDEMLKGTNSKDKRNGSDAMLKRLIKLKGCGLIATHDLELGKKKKIYPENVINKCFEVEIKDNKLEFNYKLLDGISKNMNASFLMRKMGIIEEKE